MCALSPSHARQLPFLSPSLRAGEWEAPLIDNPAYKGEWKQKQIPNPAYKGAWVHPEIDNPAFKEDPNMYNVCAPCTGLGFELWQVKSGTIFDDIIVTDSLKEAEEFAKNFESVVAAEKAEEEAEKAKKAAEEAEKKAADEKKAAEEKEKKAADDDDDDECVALAHPALPPPRLGL
jgi:calreticulin